MYCTIDDLLSRIDRRVLINLSNDVSPATEINMDCINENITIADDIINSSLRNKYSLPLPSIPKILVQISADIVIYRLYARRPQDVPKNYLQNFIRNNLSFPFVECFKKTEQLRYVRIIVIPSFKI